MSEKRSIDISTKIILKIVIVFLGLWFLFLIRDILVLLIIALILTAALEPLINWLEKKKIPRSLSIMLVYFFLFLTIGGMFSFLIPAVIYQFKELMQKFPQYLNSFSEQFYIFKNYLHDQGVNLEIEQLVNQAGNGLTYSSKSIFSTTLGVFSGFISTIAIFSLTFYMLVRKDGIEEFLQVIIPKNYISRVIEITHKIKHKLSWWMLGQLSIMFIIFLLDFTVLYLLNIPYALTLAVIGGTLELIPYAGPILSTIIASIVGFFVSPIIGFFVLGSYIIIQQIENHIILPQIMKKAVGLNPAIVILVILIGAKLAGIMGAILAVPLATALGVVIKEILRDK